jgi:hypothetical protein
MFLVLVSMCVFITVVRQLPHCCVKVRSSGPYLHSGGVPSIDRVRGVMCPADLIDLAIFKLVGVVAGLALLI